MNAKKQKRVKAPSCKYSLLLELLSESRVCITREGINFVRVDLKWLVRLEHWSNYTLERVFGVQNLKIWVTFFYCFLPFDNYLEKIPVTLFDYFSNSFNF